MRPCAFLPQFPPSGGFLPHGFHNLLALTFLILGAGLGCFFHAPSLLIKAQCRSDIYSTGENRSVREKRHSPLSSTSLLFTQRDIWEEATGFCGSRHFLLWDKLEGHGCHFV